MNHPYWTLNGTYLGAYKGLTDESVSKLKFVTEINGVKVFENSDLPESTAELWSGRDLICVIRGLNKPG